MYDDSELRVLIEPELQIALAELARRFRRTQDTLPLWTFELLESYGRACAIRGHRWAHESPTGRPSSPEDLSDLVEEMTPVVDVWTKE